MSEDYRKREKKKLEEQMYKFEKTMKELQLLKLVGRDLKRYRRMIKLKKYD